MVERPGAARGAEADAAVAAVDGVALAVVTADCAPVGLSSPEGVVGIVHAGWRGALAGVLENTVGAMRALGATTVQGALGPCIRAHAYRFSEADIATIAARYGPAVRAIDDQGRPALDLPALVAAALQHAGAQIVADSGTCTHCSTEHWSWRARRDAGRQANVLVRELAAP